MTVEMNHESYEELLAKKQREKEEYQK